MKILLVMPGRLSLEQTRMSYRALLPPSPLLEVAGLTNAKHHEVAIWDELAQGPVKDKMLKCFDLVGISGLTTSRFGAYRVAKAARELAIPVVAGGMDVTGHFLEGHKNELLAHYDAIVIGRLTSRLWAEVLADVENKRLKDVYRAGTLDAEPWEWAIWRHDLVNPKNYFFPATFRSSAGCPYGCSFCTVGLICNQVQIKPAKILLDELERLPKTRMPWIDCSDAFGHLLKQVDTALPVLKSMGHPWLTELATRDLVKVASGGKSLMARMRAAGLMGAYIGVENIDAGALGKSPHLAVTEEAIKEAHGLGMIMIASMVLDFTGKETVESVKENIEWLLENQLDLVQLSLVAALPGSTLRREALESGLMICEHPEFFDGAWPTVKHQLSAQKRIELLRDAYYRIYGLKQIRRRIWGHSYPWLNWFANLGVNRMSHNWWSKVGYEFWLANGGIVDS